MVKLAEDMQLTMASDGRKSINHDSRIYDSGGSDKGERSWHPGL